jgi:hypothetical protein
MKRIIWITAVTLLLGFSALEAQDTRQRSTKDTSSVRQKRQSQTQQSQAQRDESGVGENDDSDMPEWVRLQDRDIPTSLRSNLNDTRYKGWENSGIYRSKGGERYRVKVGDNKTTYYFDKEGKPEQKRNPN